jgi:hypothetical protein
VACGERLPRRDGLGPAGDPAGPEAPPYPFEDESLAPEVDRPLLAALARGELSEEAAKAAYRLVATFKSWSDAHVEAVAEAFRRKARG